MRVTRTFELEKLTRNTVRYVEITDGPEVVGTLYVQKDAFRDGESSAATTYPSRVRVTINTEG